MESNNSHIKIQQVGTATMVELQDREILDESTIQEISEALFGVVEDKPSLVMVLSFSKVNHLSSSALGTLIRLNKRVEEKGGSLKLCEIKESLYEIFVITRLVKLFEIFTTREMALSSVAP